MDEAPTYTAMKVVIEDRALRATLEAKSDERDPLGT
jgi:hypothetical protein